MAQRKRDDNREMRWLIGAVLAHWRFVGSRVAYQTAETVNRCLNAAAVSGSIPASHNENS